MAGSANRGRISSVGRAFDCRAGGRGFESRGRTITQGLKMTEKWRYFLCTASGETFAWLGWPRKMAVPSPLGEVKIVSPVSTFVLNTLTLKWKVQVQSAMVVSIGKNGNDRIRKRSHGKWATRPDTACARGHTWLTYVVNGELVRKFSSWNSPPTFR